MLHVKTPDEAMDIIIENFRGCVSKTETLPLAACLGRILAEDIVADEYVPDFDRSSVDGYALRAADSFGCSDSMPAVLRLAGEVRMGEPAGFALRPGECACIPTGGAVPEGADAVVMVEYSEVYSEGEIGILKPAAPGGNMVYRGDDAFPGKRLLAAGR
ncbi:MAG: molybdopterin molybdenumtransferase MoeA, partial [Clostridia bacterium]|nr:molybdopterin molybdenumtransferase MoeA [Clostridia bacterium]